MKKIVLVVLAAFVIGGCGFLPTAAPTPTQVVESPTTLPTQTDTALPTATFVLVETSSPTPELNPTITPLPTEDLTTTPATATEAAAASTATPVSFPSSATPSPTLGVLTYGTLPPAVPFNTVALSNKSKAEAYISLQQQDGKHAIIEYPVRGKIFVDIPLGSYIYVAWVGGKKMSGSFRIGVNDTITIFLYKDRIVVDKS